jgi:elongation factor G
VQGMDTEDHTTIVRALAPLSEMLTYSPTLRSITGGRGDFHMELARYDEVPRHLQEKIIAAVSKEEEEEEE